MTIATAEGILLAACHYAKLTPDEVRSKSRVKRFARTRQAICKALRQRTSWSYPHIARYVGFSDHCSAIHAVDIATVYAKTDPWFSGLLDAVMNAAPIMPMQVKTITRDVVAQRARRFVRRPVFHSVPYYNDLSMQIDKDGFEPDDYRRQTAMADGSRQLARVINALRGAA